tara:strand:+ start:640 stop:921 length:282 start_codon:yes stop_codon:yes gene_type:complete
MDINVLEMYNVEMKMGVVIKRTPTRKYKYCTQISPVRNIWTDEEFDTLGEIKGKILGEIINGYTIKQNLLGLDFIDSILSHVELPKDDEVVVV